MVVDTIALEKGLQVEFMKALDELGKKPWMQELEALFLPTKSTAVSEKYGFFGDFPQVKEWVGPKTAAGLKDYDFTIKNKDWYNAVEVDRNELEDDQTGLLKSKVEAVVRGLADWKFDLLSQLIINGATGLAYDGIPFFSDATGDRLNDNLLAGTGATLISNIQVDLGSVRSAMMKFTSDTGRKLGIVPDTIVCPPEIEVLMLQAIHSNLAGAAGEQIHNPLSKWFKAVIPLPDLADQNDWYAFCTTYVLRPFVFQERKAPTPVLDDTEVKKTRKLIFSGESRGNAGYGLPQLAAKVVNT
jgi:phage major head subunit gpT-like protein